MGVWSSPITGGGDSRAESLFVAFCVSEGDGVAE